MKSYGLAAALALLPVGASAEDYVLSLTDTGKRDYYCQIMVTLENRTDETLGEVSGYFYGFIGDEQVGRSRGAWFMNVEAGWSATSTFETPGAPCDLVERYEFIVGACRFSAGFEDQEECAARIGTTAPIAGARTP